MPSYRNLYRQFSSICRLHYCTLLGSSASGPTDDHEDVARCCCLWSQRDLAYRIQQSREARDSGAVRIFENFERDFLTCKSWKKAKAIIAFSCSFSTVFLPKVNQNFQLCINSTAVYNKLARWLNKSVDFLLNYLILVIFAHSRRLIEKLSPMGNY
jgi:hypothetical protein